MTAELTQFRWKCMDGRVLTMAEMKTPHIFNCMKLVFNHLAEEHGGEPVWFVHHYREYRDACRANPSAQVEVVMRFMMEIEQRGDLSEHMKEPYACIKAQIFPIDRRIQAGTALLPTMAVGVAK